MSQCVSVATILNLAFFANLPMRAHSVIQNTTTVGCGLYRLRGWGNKMTIYVALCFNGDNVQLFVDFAVAMQFVASEARKGRHWYILERQVIS